MAALLLWLGASPAWAADSGTSRPPARATAARTRLVVGCELSYPPFSLTRPDQSPDGFTVDLWEAVAREAGLDFVYRVAPFHEILTGFINGDVDVMINLAQSEARKEFTLFAVPHVTMHGGIFVRRDSPVRTEADLAGRRLIVLNRDLAHDYALSRGWTNLITVDDVERGLRLLSGGTGEAMLVGKLVGLNELREHDLGNVRVIDQPLEFFQKFAFAVRKDAPGGAELLARINEGLALVKARGTYDVLYERWFGVLEPDTTDWAQIVKVAVPALVLIGLLGAGYTFERRLRLRLKQSLATLNATLESTADGIVVTSPRGEILNYNRNFLRIWNLPEPLVAAGGRDEVFRRIADQTEDPADFHRQMEALQQRPESGLSDIIRLKDGRSLERHSQPQHVDGRCHGRVWCLRDVTARETAAQQAARFHLELERRVQERTLQLEAAGRELRRLSYVASQTNNMVVICSPAGLIEWCNSAFEQRTGWRLDEVRGRKPGDLLQGPETAPGSVEQMRRAIAERRPVRVEVLNYAKTGEKYWAEMDISPVMDDEGRLINFVSIQTDVTARHNAGMESVRQREELTRLNQSLQKALRSRDEFLAAMSHELRTPLNNILTFSEILAGQDLGALNERQLAYLNYVTESGHHLLSLIDDILDLIILNSEGGNLEPEWCDVESLTEASLRAVRSAAMKRQQTLECPPKAGGGGLRIFADPQRVKQVLVNLLGNAIKFTRPGGTVRLRAWQEGPEIVFEVSDNGIGIHPERVSRLFQPFVQLDSGLSREYGGAGLGLARVQAIVGQHGGRVEVASEPGRGSTFTVRLPAAGRGAGPDPEERAAAPVAVSCCGEAS